MTQRSRRSFGQGRRETILDLSDERYHALDRIPEEITTLTALQLLRLDQTAVTDLALLAGLTALQRLLLTQTAVSDLAPLAGLTALQELHLTQTAVTDLAPLAGLTALSDLSLQGTQVADLRPIRGLSKLGRGDKYLFRGLSYGMTPATKLDGDLARLAEIKDTEGRARETLAYLNTLPPWPQPYTPRARPDGQPPQPIGRAAEPAQLLPTLRTPEAQVGALLRHAIVTRVTASQLAEQIAAALRALPASDGNQLPPLLQLMSEVGEVLDMMGRTQTTAGEEEKNLRLRLAQLEVLVERLTLQLADAEAATKAAEALAKKDGFLASYRKSLGTSAGVATAGIITVGVPTAAIYFLGVEHPLVQAFLTALGRLQK